MMFACNNLLYLATVLCNKHRCFNTNNFILMWLKIDYILYIGYFNIFCSHVHLPNPPPCPTLPVDGF